MTKKRSLVRSLCTVLAGLALTFAALPAAAITECRQTPISIYVGDGLAWVVFQAGGQAKINQNSADFKSIYALLLLAINTQKDITVRHSADKVDCNSLQEIEGVWLTR
ncbi:MULTISPECIES: hypothetical protein [unclassified Janthinobacterium]|uniref:hypothetical protein n=1 Tax=unclassified Janthinobacterium TaxID=2610881 RepID=UPI0016165044|nr:MULTISPECIES: hypothetical protein [unclassified Janthinobacterium]MBB5370433.1 hypothetical protein [Janthinobacterium sp. K2C7]MBB5383353.1 hypothetical protein [Janthinobacterium sp. K2Li3]MBB5388807.1 hypothetical protein [Janthinobacterium sp. K2E3]